jgi:hypothetical protein
MNNTVRLYEEIQSGITNKDYAILNNYLEAVITRAEIAGDDKLGVAMGYVFDTLLALKLQTYELETIQRLTDCIEADTKTKTK